MKNVVAYSMIKKENKSMNELNCKKCDTPTTCDEEAVAITCSMCSMLGIVELLEGMDSNIVGEA